MPLENSGGTLRLRETLSASHSSRLLAVAGGISVAALLWAVPLVGLGLAAFGLVMILLFARPERWITIFAWGLAFHVVVMAALFGALRVPGPIVRLIAAWKEAAVILLVLSVLVRAALGRLPTITVSPNDLAVAALIALAVVYLLVFQAWTVTETTLIARLYGLRDAAFFLLLYFVGRTTPEIARDDRLLRVLISLGVVTTLAAILERIFVTPQMLVLLGAAGYFRDFLGTAPFTLGNEYGLPMNYWTALGSRVVQRAGSVYLSSQSFAISFLLIIPAATVWMLHRRRRWTAWLTYALLWIGLILTVTRMSTVVCVCEVLIVALVLRRYDVIAWTVGAVAALFALAMALVRGVPAFVWETITWQTGSSGSHLKDWGKGFGALIANPLGYGLGTSDATAVRFGLNPLTADNQFLKYGAELGLPGLVLIVLIFCGIAAASARLLRTSAGAERRFAVVVLAATVGIALNSATAVPFNCMVVAYLYFWMAGVVVTRVGPTAAEMARVG